MAGSVLDAWLREKGDLYAKGSLFKCDDACPRYGCRGDMLVTVTLLELKSLAVYLSRPALDVFDRFCSVAPFVEQGVERVRVRFVLRKPCLFLEESGYCAVYPLRPAACALFPEFLSVHADGAVYRADSDLARYPCIERFTEVPEARKEALKALHGIHRKEVYAGEIYLFGQAGASFDPREEVGRLREGRAGQPVPFSVQSKALDTLLRACGWWDRIREKIDALNTQEGFDTFFSAIRIVEQLSL